jgi:hypothetical protein
MSEVLKYRPITANRSGDQGSNWRQNNGLSLGCLPSPVLELKRCSARNCRKELEGILGAPPGA